VNADVDADAGVDAHSSEALGAEARSDASPIDHGTRIQVRRPAKLLSRDIPRHWYGGDAFASHFLDALSSTFPAGEAFFVRSVIHYREQIDDPALLEKIRGFSGQESQHSRVHADHVQLLVDQGYVSLETRNRLMDRVMQWVNRSWPANSLAGTAALEHLTAILARQLLSHPEQFTDAMHPEMAMLWRWHALEEAEHKAVAFDVMQCVVPSHRRRVLAQILNTLGLSLEVFDRLVYMLWKDGQLFRRATWIGGWRFLFGSKGLFRGLGADYRAWYRRDFHPDQIDDRDLIERSRPAIVAELAQ
jgi:predicted metal-dependent hydrolase